MDSGEHETAVFHALVTALSRTFTDLPLETVDSRIEGALGLIAQEADAERVMITRYSADRGMLHRSHQWTRPGVPPIEGDETAAAFPWLTRRVFDQREPVVLSRLDDLPPDAAQDRASFGHLGARSLIIVPLVNGGDVIGMLSVATLGHARDWPAGVVGHVELMGKMVAGALARREAQRDLRRVLAFERVIAELSATFVDAPPEKIDDHVADALGQVATVLDLDRSHVSQIGVEDHRYELTHGWVRDDLPEWRVPPIKVPDVLPWVVGQMQRGETLVVSRIADLPAEAAHDLPFLASHGPKSFVALPLIASGEVIGSMSFGAIRRERVWTADVVDRLTLVARIISGALARKRSDLKLRAAMAENERLRKRLEHENTYLQAEIKHALELDEIVGRSAALRAVLHPVDQVAPTDVAVLLRGETGTGKELIARAIHERSGRAARPLITVNCAALPASLVESELFGHEKGAFTGALRARPGRFELADGSTLFLDEIGDLEPALQAKLLRALQGGEIQRLGSLRAQKVDVRVIAATNRDLELAMKEGRFREDLYYRLSVFPITLPPLRERRDDIPLLVWRFIQSRQRALGRSVEEIPGPTMDALVAYDWPGNIRELQNVIDRALILTSGPVLCLDAAFSAAPGARDSAAEKPAGANLRDVERGHIADVLERCAWRIEGQGQAADRLGLRPSTLRNQMRRLGIRRPAR